MGSLDGMAVAKSVTGSFIQEVQVHCLLFWFVQSVDSFGGAEEVAAEKIATTSMLAESRSIEDKDRMFFSFNSVVAFPCACVCRKWA
jgi:hypothetical protein